jgi:hypothetical protein
VRAKYGLEIGVIAILHTFNGKLEFNSHVHTMITGGGLCGDTWVSSVYHDQDRLMQAWRRAVIELLRVALRAGQLHTNISIDQVEELLTQQEKRWWSIKVQSFKSKEHFLEYAGRYLRRPPIAQRRITSESEPLGIGTKTKSSIAGFTWSVHWKSSLDRWAQHILERYQHAVRSFGLFAPRALAKTSAASLPSWDRSEGRAPSLAVGLTPSWKPSDASAARYHGQKNEVGATTAADGNLANQNLVENATPHCRNSAI